MVDMCTAGAVIPDRLATYQAKILLIVWLFTSSVIDVRLYVKHESESTLFTVLNYSTLIFLGILTSLSSVYTARI